MKVLLPYHLGCDNRGCEGIARGIFQILNRYNPQLVLFDITENDYNRDVYLGLNEIGELKYSKQNKFVEFVRLICRVFQKFGISFFYNQWMSRYYVNAAEKGDTIFITGGDIYCYEGAATLPNLIIKKAKKRGIKSVLFGVSMERKFLTDEIVCGLKNFDLIITRETISSQTMQEFGLYNYLYPDPAFALHAKECPLPKYFEDEVVGINFSPFTDTDELFEKNMINVIEHVLSEGMTVCFIPHVLWHNQDDRKSIMKYLDKFGDRVHLLDTENMSYLQIRYAISKCKYFIGGRTHAVISAYSMHVPCIALGYSVKARGIANDVGMPEYTVVDSKNLHSEREILDALLKVKMNYDEIMCIYERMDEYVKRIDGLDELIIKELNGKCS